MFRVLTPSSIFLLLVKLVYLPSKPESRHLRLYKFWRILSTLWKAEGNWEHVNLHNHFPLLPGSLSLFHKRLSGYPLLNRYRWNSRHSYLKLPIRVQDRVRNAHMPLVPTGVSFGLWLNEVQCSEVLFTSSQMHRSTTTNWHHYIQNITPSFGRPQGIRATFQPLCFHECLGRWPIHASPVEVPYFLAPFHVTGQLRFLPYTK